MIINSNNKAEAHPNILLTALMSQMPEYRRALVLSFIAGIMVLAPSLFMLEVYDRVLNSRSLTTLLSLLGAVLLIYALMEIIEALRNQLLQKAGWRIDEAIRERLYDATHAASLKGGFPSTQSFQDLRTIRESLGSPAMTALLDVPCSFLFLIIVSIISPWLGVAALIGAIFQVAIGTMTERRTVRTLAEANKASIAAQNYAASVLQHSATISAMGMRETFYQRWVTLQRKFLALQASASDTAAINSAGSKFIITMQGSMILGLSCWLTLHGMLTGGGGMMIVASILGGRVLSPLVQLVTQWRLVANARDAYSRLSNFLNIEEKPSNQMPLPAPGGDVAVENLYADAPGGRQQIIRGVSFALNAGETLLIVGPSAAGKTSLARILIGIWQPSNGKVRLDGVDLHTWDKNELGPYLGYLPQYIALFDGTLAENIARFSEPDFEKVNDAIDLVGLNSLAEALPEGLQTQIGGSGAVLSGGQRQRVALARALYGNPKLVVLDEPNSNLDEEGEKALISAIQTIKTRGCTVIMISHRRSLLPVADKLLFLRDGQVAAFGGRDEVLARLQQTATARSA
ncbi:MAG: type I secretion system permease/ATPase [Betaproteobacteria bacterium]|nr:type I secretion system permease/ATPase [Betaproteobacteria bacterium]